MRNNYYFLKGCGNIIVNNIYSKLNIFPSKQIFHIHPTIIKIKNYYKK